jgi:hypothetical protein
MDKNNIYKLAVANINKSAMKMTYEDRKKQRADLFRTFAIVAGSTTIATPISVLMTHALHKLLKKG